MKTTLTLKAAVLFFLFACEQDNISPAKNPEIIENKIFNSSEFYSQFNTDSLQLRTIPGFVKIRSGRFQVFKRTYTFPDDKQIADDEYSDHIYFQRLPDKTAFFRLINQEITKENFYYKRECYCMEMIDQKIINGTITGVWQNGGCDVSANIDLMIYHGFDNEIRDSSHRIINFTGTFKE